MTTLDHLNELRARLVALLGSVQVDAKKDAERFGDACPLAMFGGGQASGLEQAIRQVDYQIKNFEWDQSRTPVEAS